MMMNLRLFCLAILVTLTTTPSQAQHSGWNVEAGLGIVNQRTVSTGLSYQNITFGVNAFKPLFGVYRDFSLGQNAAFRAGIRYAIMGFDGHGPVESVTINYVTIPLSYQYFVTPKLSFGAGVYLSFTTGGTAIGNLPITRTYHKNDDGVFLTAEHRLGGNFHLGLQYLFGHKNVILADSDPVLQNSTVVRNRAFQILLRYKFPQTRKSEP